MRAQIVSETRKVLTTRTAFGLLAGATILVGLGAWTVASGAEGAALIQPLERQPFLLVPMAVAPIFALILGIRVFTDEVRYGSLVPTLLASPRRGRVYLAKAIVAAAAGAMLALAALGVSLGVGWTVLTLSEGVTIGSSASGLLLHAARFAAVGALWGALGVGLGGAVRQQVAAIVGSLVWLLVAENVILNVAPGAARWLPGAAGNGALGLNLAGPPLSTTSALLVLGAWLAGATAAGLTGVLKRDVA